MILSNSSGIDFILCEIERKSAAEFRAFAVSQSTGRFLQMLVALLDARRVLEIGLGFGASTIHIGCALHPHGEIDSIEISPEHISIARNFIEQAGLTKRVNVMEGDALEILPSLDTRYDLVFLDADLGIYQDCLTNVVRLTRSGGVVVSENIWNQETALKLVGEVGGEQIRQYTESVYACEDLFSLSLNEEMIVSFKISGCTPKLTPALMRRS